MDKFERTNIIKNIRGIEISNEDGKTMTILCNEIETFIFGIIGYAYYNGFWHKDKYQTFVINLFDDNKVEIRHAQFMKINCIEDVLKEFNIKILEFNDTNVIK